MTSGERVRAALAGEHVDRVPLCFWHHFKPEGSGERLAQMTYEFFVEKFKLDIVKIMPDLPYPTPETTQWDQLPRLGLDTPSFQQQLICIRQLRSQLGSDFPLILTLFSPFTYIARFIGKPQAIEQARQNTSVLEKGMATIAANLHDLVQAAPARVGVGAEDGRRGPVAEQDARPPVLPVGDGAEPGRADRSAVVSWPGR